MPLEVWNYFGCGGGETPPHRCAALGFPLRSACGLRSLAATPCLVALSAAPSNDITPLTIHKTAFRCLAPRCGFVHMIYADMECSDNDIVDPTICNNELNVRGVEKPCGGNKFAEDLMLSRDGDYQEMKIQESVTNLGVGIIPRSLCVVLEHDLVDACKPGDDVNVCGTLMARWGPHGERASLVTEKLRL